MKITMQKEKVFVTRVDIDERNSRVFCYSNSAILGEELSRGKGWYGGNGHTSSSTKEVMTFDIDGEKFSFLTSDRIDVLENKAQYIEIQERKEKQAAIAKLTDREKQLLGLI